MTHQLRKSFARPSLPPLRSPAKENRQAQETKKRETTSQLQDGTRLPGTRRRPGSSTRYRRRKERSRSIKPPRVSQSSARTNATTHDRHDPMYRRVSGKGEPEERDGYEHGAKHALAEMLLGRRSLARLVRHSLVVSANRPSAAELCETSGEFVARRERTFARRGGSRRRR